MALLASAADSNLWLVSAAGSKVWLVRAATDALLESCAY